MKGRSFYLLLCVVLLAAAGCDSGEQRKAAYVARAQALQDSGQYQKARLEYKNALQIDPKDVEARYGLARVQERLGMKYPAAVNYRRVYENDPRHLGALIRLGSLFLSARNVALALKFANEAVAVAPDNLEVLTLRCAALARKGDVEGAMQDCNRVLAREPGRVDALTVVAMIDVREGRIEDAIGRLEEGLRHNPHHMRLRLLLADIYNNRGQQSRALSLYQENVTLEPANLLHRIRLAAAYARNGDVPKAEQVLREGVAYAPEESRPVLALVEFIAEHGEPERAVQELKAFIAKRPDDYRLRNGLARLYEATGQPEEARSVYLSMIGDFDDTPQALMAMNGLAGLLATQGDGQGALTLVNEVLEGNPSDPTALLLRARVALSESRSDDAISDLRQLLKGQPDNAEALVLQSYAHIQKKEQRLALESLQRAVRAQPQNPRLHLELARLYATGEETSAALAEVRQVLELSPRHTGALEMLTRLYMARREWEAALEAAARLSRTGGDRGLGHYLAGLVNVVRKDLDGAAREMDAALRDSPGAAGPLSALVRIRMLQRRPEDAELVLKRVLETNPRHPLAAELLGEVSLAQNRLQAAEEAFQLAMELKPDWLAPYRNLGLARQARSDDQGAIEAYLKGLDATTDNAALVFDLAALYEKAGAYDLAIRQYENELRDNPDSFLAANNLAMLLVVQRPDPKGLARAGELVERFQDSDNPAYLDTLGWVRYKQGRLPEAIEALEAAATRAPRRPVVHYHLGMTLYAQGDRDRSRRELETALRGDRPFEGRDEASQVLFQLRSKADGEG